MDALRCVFGGPGSFELDHKAIDLKAFSLFKDGEAYTRAYTMSDAGLIRGYLCSLFNQPFPFELIE